jgi:hypothetical protein
MRTSLSTHQSAQYRGGPDTRPPTQLWSRLAVAVLGLVISSCASVQGVTVSPSTACPGDLITVSWVARGKTELAAIPLNTPAADSPGQAVDYCVDALASGVKASPEPSRGTITLRSSGDTAFLVQAQGWLGTPAHKCAPLFVNRVLPLSNVPQCIAKATGPALRAAQVHLLRPSGSRWSATATTGLVKNDNPVEVTIRHAGRSILLPPGGETALFTGTDPNGDWWVEYTWPAGPQCGLQGAPVPNSLSLEVHPLCSSAGRATR